MDRKRCSIYCRQSSGQADPDDSLSIELQVDACKKLAADRGLEVIEIYREADTSGRLYPDGYEALEQADIAFQSWLKTTNYRGKHRTELGKLLKSLGSIDYVVVFDATRFHRSLSGSFLGQLLMNILKEAGVKILSAKEGIIDPEKFTDMLVSTLTSSIASQQLIIQREKAMAAQKKLKEAGEWTSAAASSFGYKSSGRKHEVVLDSPKCEAVKKIYELFLAGWTPEAAGKEACKLMPNGSCINRAQAVRILKNVIYTGYCKLESGELVKVKPLDGLELVSFSDWKLVQEIFESHKKITYRPKMTWLPLSGVFYCGECGHKMQAHSKTVKTLDVPIGVAYRCRSHYGRTKSSCKIGLTWHTVEEGGAGLEDALKPLAALAVEPQVEDTAELTVMQAKVESLKKKQESLVALFKRDLLSAEELEDALSGLKPEREAAEKALNDLKKSLSERLMPEQWLTDIEGIDKPQAEVEALLRKAMKKVTIWKSQIEVETCSGSFQLPVKRIWHSNELPVAHQLLKQDEKSGEWSEDLVYCFGEDLPRDFEKKMKLLLDAGRIKLWIVR